MEIIAMICAYWVIIRLKKDNTYKMLHVKCYDDFSSLSTVGLFLTVPPCHAPLNSSKSSVLPTLPIQRDKFSSSHSSSLGGSPKLSSISAALFWTIFKFHWFSSVLGFLTELSPLKNVCLEKQNHLWLQNYIRLFFGKVCEASAFLLSVGVNYY